MAKPSWIWLGLPLAVAWPTYFWLVFRQTILLAQADPSSDTGLAFGYKFLVWVWGPALVLVTIAFFIAVFVSSSRRLGGY